MTNIKEIISNGYDNIKSIVGIGELGAIVLLYLFLKYPNTNKRAKISKAGAKIYRGILFMGLRW